MIEMDIRLYLLDIPDRIIWRRYNRLEFRKHARHCWPGKTWQL